MNAKGYVTVTSEPGVVFPPPIGTCGRRHGTQPRELGLEIWLGGRGRGDARSRCTGGYPERMATRALAQRAFVTHLLRLIRAAKLEDADANQEQERQRYQRHLEECANRVRCGASWCVSPHAYRPSARRKRTSAIARAYGKTVVLHRMFDVSHQGAVGAH